MQEEGEKEEGEQFGYCGHRVTQFWEARSTTITLMQRALLLHVK